MALNSIKILLTIVLVGYLADSTWGQVPVAVPIDGATHRVSYTAVVPLTGTSQMDLLARARNWTSGITATGQPATVTSEPDAEIVIAAGNQAFTETRNGKGTTVPLHFTAKILLREGRYKYELTDFVFVYPASGIYPAVKIPADDYFNGRIMPIGESGSHYNDTMRKRFGEAATKLVASLREAMNKPASIAGTK